MLTVGIDDRTVRLAPIPQDVVAVDEMLGLRFLPEWEVHAAGIEPGFWIRPMEPRYSERRVLFETLSAAVIEQDERGRLWIDDDLLHRGLLVGFGAPHSRVEGALHLGSRASLLLVQESRHGWELTLRVTTPVVWIYARPNLSDGMPMVSGWLGRDAQVDLTRLGPAA